jgi:hypothetical protein
MKHSLSFLLIAFFSLSAFAQKNNTIHQINTTKQVQVVETACGQCQFGMDGEGCKLAVRIHGKPYFVDGTDINDHGDAHAKDGFCNAIRKATVQGEIKEGRFDATYFKLADEHAPKKKGKKA